MLNEPSVFSTGRAAGEARPPVAATVPQPRVSYPELEAAVQDVMDIYKVSYDPPPPRRSRLRTPAHRQRSRLRAVGRCVWRDDYHALLTTDEAGQHVVLAIKGASNRARAVVAERRAGR